MLLVQFTLTNSQLAARTPPPSGVVIVVYNFKMKENPPKQMEVDEGEADDNSDPVQGRA